MTNLKKVLVASAAFTMLSGAAWAGSDNTATVDQFDGAYNKIYIDQDVYNNGANHNEVGYSGGDSFKQGIGNGNDVRIIQGGDHNISDGSIYGNNNTLRVNQANSTNSYTRVDTYPSADNNNLSITQSGDDQEARLTVGGDNNALAVQQSGRSQFAKVTILGSGNNTGGTSLYGPAGELGLTRGSLIQSGFDNTVNMTINDGANDNAFAISQNGTVAGFGNTVNATISGSGGALAVLQNGANNLATINQGGYGNSMAVKQ